MSAWARAVPVGAGLLALGSLWVTWFEPGKDELIIFGSLDRFSDLQKSAWEAFGWEDVALATLAVATVVLGVAGRPWFAVPVAGFVLTGAVLLMHRSFDLLQGIETGGPESLLPAKGTGAVPLVAFAAAAAVLYRSARRR